VLRGAGAPLGVRAAVAMPNRKGPGWGQGRSREFTSVCSVNWNCQRTAEGMNRFSPPSPRFPRPRQRFLPRLACGRRGIDGSLTEIYTAAVRPQSDGIICSDLTTDSVRRFMIFRSVAPCREPGVRDVPSANYRRGRSVQRY